MRLYVAICLIAVALCAPGQAADRWIRLTTPHFELLTTASEKKGREGILYFETVRQFFIDAGIAETLPPERLRIVAFHSDNEFRPYAPNEVASAFYLHVAGHDDIVLGQLDFLHYPVAIHEYTHFIFRQRSGTLPIWLNEGLAELFSTLRPEGKQMVIGEAIPHHVDLLAHHQLLELETLFAADSGSPLLNERIHAGLFYSESWALVDMFFASSLYNPHFGAFWQAIESGLTSAAALRHAYGRNVGEVQKDLRRYLDQRQFPIIAVPVKLDPSAAKPAIQTLSEWDARLALAEILAHSAGQQEIGGKILMQLMAEQPERPETPAILAGIALREGRYDEAIRLFNQASKLGSADPEMYYLYALALASRGGSEVVLAALRKAVELKPDYAKARVKLGLTLMERGRNKEALEELSLVGSPQPEDAIEYYQALHRLQEASDTGGPEPEPPVATQPTGTR